MINEKFDTIIEKNQPYEDFINNPSYYTKGRKYEPIDVIEDWKLSYCLGNALKYISRAGRKDKSTYCQDLKKAVWYLERAIQENK
jgi:hypothetical protein